MQSVRKLAFILLVASFLVFSLIVSTSQARASKAASNSSGALPGIAGGSAYAGSLKVPAGSSIASVGPLFPVSLGCALSNQNVSASAASMSLRGFASSNSLSDSVTTSRTTSSVSIQASATVQNVTLLAGLISATVINSVASSTATLSSASSSNNSTFVGLVIAGIPISGTPSPNTTITLAGLGSVILNEQVGPSNKANATSISVTAIDVKVTLKNVFGLPIGTHILIAHAQTSFTRTAMLASVSARAYALSATARVGSGFVASGPWALANIGCAGGNSTVNLASVSVPVVGSTGTMTDTAFGQITTSSATSNSSSTIQQVNLLNGTITADVITSTAQASSNGTASASTTLANAVIAGITLSANPGPNTKITIAGLGVVVVNEQTVSITSTGVSASVNAIDLLVTVNNSFGLPIGLRIIVGHANAGVATA